MESIKVKNIKLQKIWIIICIEDISKIDSDFVDTYGRGIYKKRINQNDLAEYKGKTFNVSPRIVDGKVFLGTGDAKLAMKYQFDRTDKYYYEKWFPLEEVILTENRKDIILE
ncbi:hypothetical protein QQB53_06090 [Niallia sp. SS-2023]|uniref:hypothetical protein n=1 Tax=Niallia sp. SS-2023 TaxID=3051155 RepID=UPI001EDB8033|nr:hypothetical protein [Niallia sp. SS-2023]MDL0435336.1 hypothetical protein [Niallia sp. SS-2023]